MPDCKTCKKSRETISIFAHEEAMARQERHIKRLVIALIAAIIAIVLINCAWIWAWVQYDYESEEVYTQEEINVDAKDGIANYIGNDGDIVNGADKG